MRSSVRFIAAALALLSAPAAPAQTPAERERLDWTLERGRLLFGVDRAAWVATDEMFVQVPDPQGAGMRGYVVEREGEGFLVTFYGGPEDAPVAVYRARVGAAGVVSDEILPPEARPPLTELQRRLVTARESAAGMRWDLCADRPPNVAPIPPETPGGSIDFYVMTPQVTFETIPMGGHHRATLTPDGQVIGKRAFSNSCLPMPTRPGKDGAKPVGLLVTHVLDPVPTEIHVFTALATGNPVWVGTGPEPGRMWQVTGDRIELIEDGAPLGED